MKIIKKLQPNVDDLELIKWATINGARALGMEAEFGNITKGCFPGINWISVEVDADGKFDLSTALRIVKLG
jgi:cytosine/adenosine deaminase-related metal-dependent hydrolase